MSRAGRLLDLIQLLRRHRRPVGGQALAEALGISLRTLYRDIATLQAQGARIDGAPGLGYSLHEGFVLPPLMFTVDEIEALQVGTQWVADRGDPHLAAAARDALAKIAAVLPGPLRHELDASALIVAPAADRDEPGPDLSAVRGAIRRQLKLTLDYRDAGGTATRRVVWPFALGYFEQVRVLVAWCELRQDMRHFRCDRIAQMAVGSERYPRSRQALLVEWRERERPRASVPAADGI